MDKYKDFAELSNHEIEDRDFRIRYVKRPGATVILAPHGGRIERGTSFVAEAVAGKVFSFYAFEGLKPRLRDNRALHITSNRFDEPCAVNAVVHADRVIAIHGARGMESAVYLGGLDMELRAALQESCRAGGFFTCDDPSPTRQGKGRTNICNRGRSGKGLQVELTFGLRKTLFIRDPRNGCWRTNKRFDRLVHCFRLAMG